MHNLRVTMVGDLKNGRTVHSLSQLLQHYDVELNFVSPSSLKMVRKLLVACLTLTRLPPSRPRFLPISRTTFAVRTAAAPAHCPAD